MTPISLTLERFGSFERPTVFRFPQGPGLFFMRGVNRADPRLEANGVGKSTLWSALTWLLYERTVKGLRAGDVCTWGRSKGTTVSFTFEHDGGHFVVERTWSPNSWTLTDLYEGITDTDTELRVDLTKHPDNPVLATLRTTLATWLQTVVIASGESMFLDLKPEAKTQFLADVLGLQRWDDLAARASKRAGEQDRKVRDLESNYARLEGRVHALQQQHEQQGDAQRWEQRYLEDVADLAERYTKAKQQLATAKEERDKERRLLQLLQGNKTELLNELRPQQEALDKARKLEAEVQGMLKAWQADLNAAADDGKCPTCGQAWAQHNRTKHVSDYKQMKEAAARATEVVEGLAVKVAKGLQEVGYIDHDLAITQRAYDRADNDVRHYTAHVDRLSDEADRLAQLTNPHKEQAARQRRELQDAEDDLHDARDRLDAANARYLMLATWAGEFKAIRLQQMEEALQQLEMEVAGRCTELGLVGWSLQFALDKVSKKGTVTRGFTVTVLSPYNDEPAPWEAWSGGEKQRLRLAAQMGLADLARGRLGIEVPLEVWDEPTQGLSAQGITDLLDCLATRAQREQRQVWVVDHHSLGYGGFDGVVTVVREQQGSTLET